MLDNTNNTMQPSQDNNNNNGIYYSFPDETSYKEYLALKTEQIRLHKKAGIRINNWTIEDKKAIEEHEEKMKIFRKPYMVFKNESQPR